MKEGVVLKDMILALGVKENVQRTGKVCAVKLSSRITVSVTREIAIFKGSGGFESSSSVFDMVIVTPKLFVFVSLESFQWPLYLR